MSSSEQLRREGDGESARGSREGEEGRGWGRGTHRTQYCDKLASSSSSSSSLSTTCGRRGECQSPGRSERGRESERTDRIPEDDALELLDLARQRRTHEEALVHLGEPPRAREDRADVVARVAVREDEVGLVNDEVVEVLEVQGLFQEGDTVSESRVGEREVEEGRTSARR